jgi:hypothetical protein
MSEACVQTDTAVAMRDASARGFFFSYGYAWRFS